MIDKETLNKRIKQCGTNDRQFIALIWHMFYEYEMARSQAEDVLKLDTESRKAIAVLQARLDRLERNTLG